jgi:uncharacterized protein YndB with AHSA1/START domain
MKKHVGLYGLALALPFVLFFGIAAILPPKFENHETGDVQAPADLVFELLTTSEGLSEWVMWAADGIPGMTGAPAPGPTSGVGAGWRWSQDGEPWGSLEVAEMEAPTWVLYKIDYDGQIIERELVLEAAGTTTTIDWSERHWVPRPSHRWIALIMDDAIEADIRASIRAIDAAAAVRWAARSSE